MPRSIVVHNPRGFLDERLLFKLIIELRFLRNLTRFEVDQGRFVAILRGIPFVVS